MGFLSLAFRDLMNGLVQGSVLQNELDNLIAHLQAWADVEHNDDGSHGAISAESMHATGDISGAAADLSGGLIVRGSLVGPVPDGVTAITHEFVHVLGDASVSEATPMVFVNNIDNSGIAEITVRNGSAFATLRAHGSGSSPASESHLEITKIFEKGRVVALGHWTSVAYAAGNFTASAGTWTVDSGDVTTYAYALDGQKMTVAFYINNTDVSNAGAVLRIKIPDSKTATKYIATPIQARDNGSPTISIRRRSSSTPG